MKQDIESLDNMFNKVKSYQERKRDYISDVRSTEMQYIGGDVLKLSIDGDKANWPIDDHTLRQMGTWAHLPASYVSYMRREGRGDLIADNFNEWFSKPVHEHTRRLYRGMSGEYSDAGSYWRSFHSDRFNRFDHEHMLEALMPELERLEKEFGGIKVVSLGLTDGKLYVKVVFPETEAKAVGDVVQFGLTIGNSEIGLSKLFVLPLAYVLRCLNGMTLPDEGMTRRHIGSVIEETGNVTYAQDTVEADQIAIQKKLRDTIRSVTTEERMKGILDKINDSSLSEKTVNPMKAVEKTAELFSLTDKEAENTTLSFVRRGDYSKWGMVNAVTEIANTHDNYDRASDIENIGGRILAMDESRWNRIAIAA